MPTLIVEDGTGLANSNTYVSLAQARTIAADLGITLPADDDAASARLLAAMAYIESKTYTGHAGTGTQALQWPRKLATYKGYPLAADVIPNGVKNAQVVAASMSFNGTELYPTVSGQFITEETVGPITTKYSDEFLATVDGQNVLTAIDVYLQPYMIQDGGYRLSKSFGF